MSIDISNWREPDHVNFSFRNIDKILHTQPIDKGTKTSELPSKLINVDGFKIERPEKPPLDLPSFLSETETDGLIVLKDGNVAYEYYGRNNTSRSVHIMMSMTKSVTAFVCGMLVQKGQLDVNALIANYVPEIRGTPYEQVTVRQCLDMRTGIKFDDSDEGYRSAAAWQPFDPKEKPIDLHEFLSHFHAPTSPEIEGLDGRVPFEYLSVNTDLMGWVIERASGKKFAQLVSELVWKPIGAEHDAYIATDRSGNARPAGGMCATLRDIARFGNLALHDDSGIVPESWIQDILNNGSKEAFDNGAWKRGIGKVFGNVAYRSYWLADGDNQTLIAMGVYGQLLIVDRKNRMVMAKTSSQPDRVDMERLSLASLAFKEFRSLLDRAD